MKKLILPALLSIVFLTSCSQALYKNKYDWVKVDRQPVTVAAKSEVKPAVSSSEIQPPATTVVNSTGEVDSAYTVADCLHTEGESKLNKQKEVKEAVKQSLTNQHQVLGTVTKPGKAVKSGFSRFKVHRPSADHEFWGSVWSITRLILIVAAIAFLIWAIGGLEAVLVVLAVGAGIVIGIMLIVFVICEIIGEIFDSIFS